jgi:putative nucleotidyltransferase with HDIG domain
MSRSIAAPRNGPDHAELLAALVDRGQLELPLLSEGVSRMIAETGHGDADARRLAETVRRDPALAGRLLELANSSAFGGREKVVSLQQAVCRLGALALRQLVLTVAARTRVFRIAGREAWVRALFQHCVLTGLHAQEIARLKRLSVEDAFLAGLFHDVGKAVLMQASVDLCQVHGPADDEAAVTDCIHALHAREGARLVRAWQLPERLALAVARHHDYDPADAACRGACVVALADALATATMVQDAASEAAVRMHPALAAVGVYPEEVDRLLAGRERALAQAQEIA